MAEVFEAEVAGELGFVRRVAIKRMLGEVASDPLAARRFIDEARIASRLHHANIVAVSDVGLLDGLPFQVLELVDGLDVHALQGRAGTTLPVEVALVIAGEVAHALDHAHSAVDAAGVSLGIVHRDVKPSNILVAWSGDVKLGDFGIALAHERASRTEAGAVAGTMGFMSPEQRMRSTVDGRSDVFALGLALHAMLAGYTPLRDITVEIALLEGVPIVIDPMIPGDVRAILERALAPRRIDRPTAAEIANDLGRVLAPRLQRDGKSVVRDFVTGLREQGARRNALDQVLGLEVVLSAAGAEDEPPHYELRETMAAGPRALLAAAASPQKRTTRAPIGIAVLGVAAVAGGAVYFGTRPPAVATPHDGGVALAHRELVPVVEGDAEVIAPIGDAAIAIDAAPRDAAVRLVLHHVAAPRDAAVVVPVGDGYLQVTGELNVGAEVLLDDQPIGHAPDLLRAPLGPHRMEVRRADGSHDAWQIELTDHNTLSHPLKR